MTSVRKAESTSHGTLADPMMCAVLPRSIFVRMYATAAAVTSSVAPTRIHRFMR